MKKHLSNEEEQERRGYIFSILNSEMNYTEWYLNKLSLEELIKIYSKLPPEL